MKIVLPGGSGQVGTLLARAFARDGHAVTVLSRQNFAAMMERRTSHPTRPEEVVAVREASALDGRKAIWRNIYWDAVHPGAWEAELEDADAVINLAGRSVNCRYTSANRRVIKESRVDSARLVGEAIARCARPPRVWLQASTATIYAHRYDAPNDETTGILGGNEPGVPDTWNFSIDVAKSWERAAESVPTPGTRLVLMRSAITMNADPGSAFSVLLNLVRLGLGGTNGDGRQFVSWVHEEDFVRAICWLIEHEELSGPVNIAAPHPLPNREFMRAFRAAWGMPFGLPANRWMLELAAFFMRTETELILKSRRVVSTRLEQSGFAFRFPDWAGAARDLCRRWREQRG